YPMTATLMPPPLEGGCLTASAGLPPCARRHSTRLRGAPMGVEGARSRGLPLPKGVAELDDRRMDASGAPPEPSAHLADEARCLGPVLVAAAAVGARRAAHAAER